MKNSTFNQKTLQIKKNSTLMRFDLPSKIPSLLILLNAPPGSSFLSSFPPSSRSSPSFSFLLPFSSLFWAWVGQQERGRGGEGVEWGREKFFLEIWGFYFPFILLFFFILSFHLRQQPTHFIFHSLAFKI